MITTTEEVAAALLGRLRREVGGPVEITQIEIVAAENGGADHCCYIWTTDGACISLGFPTPAFFDPCALETLMLRGDASAIRSVH